MRATRLPDPTAQADRASTVSGSSLAEPFPDVSQSQYDAIARVVAALPPGTSTWASFSEAYARLDVDEEDCYSLFLKLSLERGRDWHEKWEAAKASLEGRRIATGEQGGVGGTFELLRRKVNSVTSPAPATTGRTARPPSTPAGIAEPRVRSTTTPRPRSVPFQVAPRSTRDFLVRATHERTSSSEDDLPIPRIETPPSHRPRSSLSRPRPRESLPPPSLSFSSPPDPDVPFVPSSHLTKLDTAATHFRRLSLLSTFFAGWRTQHSFLLLQASKADSARRAIDLSQSLLHWRDQLGRLRQKQRGLRDLERVWRKGRLRTVWKEWGRRVREKKEREKLERGRLRDEKMRKALVTVGKKWEGKAMRECFDHWYRRTLVAKADNFRGGRLLGTTLQIWRQRHSRLAQLNDVADRFSKEKVLVLWMRKSELQYLEGNFVRTKGELVLKSCWEWWMEQARKSAEYRRLDSLADRFRVGSRFAVWRRRFARLQSLTAKCDAHLSQVRLTTLGTHTKHWHLLTLSSSLLRSHRARSSPRLLSHCLANWIERYERNKIELDGRALALLLQSSKVLVSSAWDQWTDVLACRRRLESQAEKMNDERVEKLARGSWEVWRQRTRERKVDEAKAEVARDFFLQRRVWNEWRAELGRRKLESAEREVGQRMLGRVFRVWLMETRKLKAQQVVLENFQAAVDLRILGDAVKKWTTRVVDLRSREIQTDEVYNDRLRRIAFETWSTVCARHVEQYSLVDSFRQVCSDDLRKRVFTHWLKTTRRVLELDRRLEARQAAERRIVFVTVFERLRERSLRKLEQQVVERRLQRELSASLLLWKERTKILPAIQRDRINSRRRVFDAWRDQVPNPKLVRLAAERDKSTTTRQCLSVWRVNYQARVALRSASRFRSFASSSANSPTLTTPSRSVLPTRASPPASTPTRSYSLRPSFPRTSPTPSPATPVFTSRLPSSVSPLATPRRSPTSQDVEERASEAMRSRLRAAASRAHRNE